MPSLTFSFLPSFHPPHILNNFLIRHTCSIVSICRSQLDCLKIEIVKNPMRLSLGKVYSCLSYLLAAIQVDTLATSVANSVCLVSRLMVARRE